MEKLLEKDPSKRQSAFDVSQELSALAGRLAAPSLQGVRSLLRPIYAIPAVVILLFLAAAGVLFYQRSEQRHWVREQAIPDISRASLETASRRVPPVAQGRAGSARRSSARATCAVLDTPHFLP